jgi:hypothetical protein
VHQLFVTSALSFSASKNKLLLFASAGGGEDTGLLLPHPFLFSLAQEPQLEK